MWALSSVGRPPACSGVDVGAAGAGSLLEFAREVSVGVDWTTPAEQRRIYRLLGLSTILTPDPGGGLIGRRRYRIACDGALGATG